MAQNIMKRSIELVVTGGSAGSLEALLRALPNLNTTIPFAIIIVLHRKSNADTTLVDILSSKTALPVVEINDKEPVIPGHIYLAPADYHLLVEKDRTLSLDYSEKVNFSRPSIDITFQTAAETYQDSLACLLMSGANADGAAGLEFVKSMEGITAVQSPATAEVPFMPQQALNRFKVDFIVDTDNIASFINGLSTEH